MRKLACCAACLWILQGFGTIAEAKDAPKADNTAQNHGALRQDAVTAEKQSNGKNEVDLLASVRKSIMAEKGLSMDAQNVKIVCSKKGRVTLRGPVNSLDEKSKVGELAKSCEGVSSVKNELTVAAKPH